MKLSEVKEVLSGLETLGLVHDQVPLKNCKALVWILNIFIDNLFECDLSDILEMNVSAISQHLRKLKDRNLITSQKEGQIIHYSLVTDHSPLLYPIFDLLDKKEQIKPVIHE